MGDDRGRGRPRGRGGGFKRPFSRPPGQPGSGCAPASAAKGPAAIVDGGRPDHWRNFFSVDEFADEGTRQRLDTARRFVEAKKMAGPAIEYSDLVNDATLRREWPSLRDDLRSSAAKVLGVFGMAMTPDCPEDQGAIVRPRLSGFDEFTTISRLRASDVGKLVSVKGTVVRVANVGQACAWLTFACDKCDSLCSVEQRPLGRYTRPNRCPQPGCRSQAFTAMRSDRSTLACNRQIIRLQEVESSQNGRVSRTVDCHLAHDLCDSTSPGDVLTLTAIVKVSTESEGGARGANKFTIYLDVVSVANGSQGRSDKTQLEFSLLDYSAIQELFSLGPELFKLLVASLCPSIYGHELVKAGLVLALFGGVSKFAGDRAHVSIRGDPHVLVVGDPGLGKSQMLQSCSNVAPKSVFVTATGASATGLTVTMTKGPGNEFVLEAGALVLADQGCCCIDEFDKMSSQHPALLEAMEQQSISLAKSGVVCTLPAHTAILAAANPVGGHYNKAKTVAENLRLNPALLSRFDLVFILIDRPNQEVDTRLSDHVMGLHGGAAGSLSASAFSSSTPTPSSSSSLGERLSAGPGEEVDLLPHDLMRKYIAYARRYVRPKLSEDAARAIQAFYLHLRQTHHTGDGTPITTRQLESVVRLAEARAKLELREVVTESDANEVIEVMKASMVDTFSDDFGVMDFSRSAHGSGMSSTAKKKRLVAALQRAAARRNTTTFAVEEMRAAAMSVGLPAADFDDALASLNNHGYVIKKSAGVYQLLSA